MAVLRERDARDLESTHLRVEDIAELDFLELLEFFEQIVRHNASNRNMVQLAHLTSAEATTPDHPAHEWVVDRTRSLHLLCAAALEKSIASGKIRADVDPQLVATLLVAASEGLENQWLLDSSINLGDSFKGFADMLRRDLTPVPGKR